MERMKNHILAAGVVLLGLSAVFTAGSAKAAFDASVTLAQTETGSNFGTPNWSESVAISGTVNRTLPAGAFRVTDTSNNANYLAFCFELTQFIGLPETYNVTQTGPSPTTSVLLDQLFTKSIGFVNDALTAASFQVAVWEIVADSLTGEDVDLTSGDFILDAGTFNDAVREQAEIFLGNLTGPGDDFDLYYFRNTTEQDLILWDDKLSNNEVSAPATSILVALSLGGLVLVRRKLA
jgi:hypothetical protein